MSEVQVAPSPKEEPEKQIALCFPNRGVYTSELARFFMGAGPPEGYRFLFISSNSTSIASNRNTMVNRALEREGVEWILQIDSDQVVDKDKPKKLLEHIQEDKFWCNNCERVSNSSTCDECGEEADKMDIRVLSAFTFIYQNELPVPLIPQGEGGIESRLLPNSDLIKSNRVGTGCLLTHRSVFEEIDPPYFQNKFDESGERMEAEDFEFAKKLEEKGISSYIDFSIKVGHKNKVSLKSMALALSAAFQCESFQEFKERF